MIINPSEKTEAVRLQDLLHEAGINLQAMLKEDADAKEIRSALDRAIEVISRAVEPGSKDIREGYFSDSIAPEKIKAYLNKILEAMQECSSEISRLKKPANLRGKIMRVVNMLIYPYNPFNNKFEPTYFDSPDFETTYMQPAEEK